MIPYPRLIDDDGNEVRRIRPLSVSIDEQIVPLSTAEMTLFPGDSVPFRSYVEMYTANGSAGYFRAKTPSIGYGEVSNVVQLEHAICEVGDYIVKGEIEQQTLSLEDALLTVFSHYSGSKWQMGTVDVTADVVISGNYSNVLQMMNSLIALVPSAMLTFDFTTTPWTWNVREREQTVSAEGRLSRNIASVTIQKNDNELCTRVWLTGLSDDPLESYMDAETIEQYGIIEKALDGSDYTYEQAVVIATSYLEKHQHPSYSVSINGIDLSSITGESLDQFEIGKLYRLIVPSETEPIEETIVGISWGDVYGNPNLVSITLSEEEEQSTASILQSQSTEIYGNGGLKEKVNRDISDVSSALANRYSKQAGTDITSTGIDLHGSNKTLKVRAGARLVVTRNTTSITDFNAMTDEGFYALNPSAMSNKPSDAESADSELEVSSIGSNVIVQKLYQASAMYIRRRTSATWGSWYKHAGTAV